MVTLNKVEILGFREAVRKERTLRDRAFLGGNEIVAGVVVRQLSLRTVLYLEHAQNGFMIPFRFDDDLEVLAHAVQVLYFSTPKWRAPEVEPYSFWKHSLTSWREEVFRRKALRGIDPVELVNEVREWTDEAFMDCPSGGGADGVPKPSYASHPAHLTDLFAAAHLNFTYDEIMDMPLKRLWQHWRLAANRVYDVKLTNPSDEIAVREIAKGAA